MKHPERKHIIYCQDVKCILAAISFYGVAGVVFGLLLADSTFLKGSCAEAAFFSKTGEAGVVYEFRSK